MFSNYKALGSKSGNKDCKSHENMFIFGTVLWNNPQVIFLLQSRRCLWMWPFLGRVQHIHRQPGVLLPWSFGVRVSAGSLTVVKEHRHSLWKANWKQVSAYSAFFFVSFQFLGYPGACCSEIALTVASHVSARALARLRRSSGIQPSVLNFVYLFIWFSLIL